MSKKSTVDTVSDGPRPLVRVRSDQRLSTAEVARMLGIGEQKVHKLADAEVLRCERDGNNYRRFYPEDVAHYLFMMQARRANISIQTALQKVHEAGVKGAEDRRDRR